MLLNLELRDILKVVSDIELEHVDSFSIRCNSCYDIIPTIHALILFLDAMPNLVIINSLTF